MLKKLGVLVKARNFLIFQGDVESIASKTPIELTKLIEQISGSDEHRDEYEDLENEKAEAETKTIHLYQRKRTITSTDESFQFFESNMSKTLFLTLVMTHR